jgi:hypothetical protein
MVANDGVIFLWHFSKVSINDLFSRVASHLFSGGLAGIGKLPALVGWYIGYGMYGFFCTVRFGGSSILWNLAGTPLKRGAWSIKKGAEAKEKGVPAKCIIPKVFTKFSFGNQLTTYQENTNRYHIIPKYQFGMQLYWVTAKNRLNFRPRKFRIFLARI